MSYPPSQTVIVGNSVDIAIDPSNPACELRADVIIAEYPAVRVWGQVVNCYNQPVPFALVKLVEIIDKEHSPSYKGIAHTVTDQEGFYQFDVYNDTGGWYKILVSKTSSGEEVIISDHQAKCPSFNLNKTLPDLDPCSCQLNTTLYDLP